MEKKKYLLDYPDLLKEWDYKKNATLCNPQTITAGSNKKVWWICPQGHSYSRTVEKRTSRGTGCPYCSGKRVLKGFNDLETVQPELLVDWDYSKNTVKPDSLVLHSNKVVWWKCHVCGWQWSTKLNDRANGRGCPVCAKEKRVKSFKASIIQKGINDLETLRPELAKEWNYSKNGNAVPSDFTCSSSQKVWWKCKTCGYEWQALISNRVMRNSGCPKCMKYNRTSFPEQALFFYIKKVFPTTENSYQDIFGSSLRELDIYIPEIKTGIEYDGSVWHQNDHAKKVAKEKYGKCKENGIRLIRVTEDVAWHKDYCDLYIIRKDATDEGLDSVISQVLAKLTDTIIDIDTQKDRSEILRQYITVIKDKSIASKYPDVIKEWDSAKNKGITPDMVNASTNRKYWWKCAKGHSYQMAPSNKLYHNLGCPICSGKQILEGFNDLETKYPSIAKNWDYEKNAPILPSQVMPGSQKKYWWRCDYGHSFLASPNNRTANKTGCPICSNKSVLPGVNDLATTNPEMMKTWNYSKNNALNISPEKVTCGSEVKVWWMCENGHEWMKPITSQVRHNFCPVCRGKKLIPGVNDLATLRPNLSEEWNQEKNQNLTPRDVTEISNKKVWWKCKICGYEWLAVIRYRTQKGTGCPACGYSRKILFTRRKNLVLSGKSLAIVYPEIAAEWDYGKNGDVTPSEISFGANIKPWWICPNGHSYQAWLTDRTGKHHYGCPVCRKNNRKKEK